MGDNRNYSLDARYWQNHYISRDKMVAKVFFEYFPTPKVITKVESGIYHLLTQETDYEEGCKVWRQFSCKCPSV